MKVSDVVSELKFTVLPKQTCDNVKINLLSKFS